MKLQFTQELVEGGFSSCQCQGVALDLCILSLRDPKVLSHRYHSIQWDILLNAATEFNFSQLLPKYQLS